MLECAPGISSLASTGRVLWIPGVPVASQPVSRPSKSSSGLNSHNLRPNQSPMSPTAHLEAALSASNPQNPPKTSGFSMFLQCQQLSILGAF